MDCPAILDACFDKYVFIVRIHPRCLMGISCVRCKLFYSQVLYIYYNNNNNGTVPHSTRSPLPTCFWLKAWAEPPSTQIEAPLRGRAWSVTSSQWMKGEQDRGAPANGRPVPKATTEPLRGAGLRDALTHTPRRLVQSGGCPPQGRPRPARWDVRPSSNPEASPSERFPRPAGEGKDERVW